MIARKEKQIRKDFIPNRAWTRVGILFLGALVLTGHPVFTLAQSQNDASPRNFLQRLRAPFEKSTPNEPVPEAPSGFSDPTLQEAPPEPASGTNGWVQIGTSYTTPSTGIQPDPTSSGAAVPPPVSYNPGTRNSAPASAPNYSIPVEGTPAVPANRGEQTVLVNQGTDSSLPAPFPVTKREFHLPFGNFLSIIPQDQLKEVRLYVSRDNGASWKSYQTMSKEKIQTLPNKNFPVATASDGEFWFAVRVVNLQGVETPGASAPPTWRVVVNTTGKPLDSVMNHLATTPASGQDENIPSTPPLASLTNGRPQWSPNPDGSLAAGESAQRETSGQNHPSQNPNLVIFSVKDRGQNSIPDVSLPVYKIPNAKPLEALTNPTLLAEKAEKTEKNQQHLTAKPQAETDTNPADLDSISLDASPETPESLNGLETPAENQTDEDMILMLSDSPAEEGLNSKIRYVNDPNLSIDYDVSMVGSSGVGRVELWGTLDDGQTWTYMAEDKDCVSPMNVTLKSDGKFGFQILVFNGAGVGMERPQSGSMPQMEVVLDRINPRVQLYGIQLQAEFGDLEVTWGAEDSNLGSNPVLLSWSSTTEGPWKAMTHMPLENTGRYTWRIPEGVPGKVFVRIDVCDLSKNGTTLVTGPVVTDIVRPTGVILDAKPAR